MTQEEKFKEAKRLYETANADQRYVLESLFPELKESEDERIRKALINGFNKLDKSAVWYNGITNGQILTWLEKQAQKPAWSKEDKNMLEWVTGYLENKMLNAPMGEERTACKNAIARLEKLKGEPNPCDGCINRKGCINCENGELRETEQKPWSEADENHVKSILSTIECCKARFPNAHAVVEAYNADIDWLKSLRHRLQWKPSDEHIHWLKWATNRMPDTEKANEAEAVLEELLEELKKLKEE